MTSWCYACWKGATSSVPTWWTGLKCSAATPTAQSPWGSTSFVSRATWWAPHQLDSWTEVVLLRLKLISDVGSESCDLAMLYATLWQWYLLVLFVSGLEVPKITKTFFFFTYCIFLFPQNDQSTEDLHIVGAEDLSFLAGKVIFFLSPTESSVAFYKEQHLCPAEHHSKLISKFCCKKNTNGWCSHLGNLSCSLPHCLHPDKPIGDQIPLGITSFF